MFPFKRTVVVGGIGVVGGSVGVGAGGVGSGASGVVDGAVGVGVVSVGGMLMLDEIGDRLKSGVNNLPFHAAGSQRRNHRS